MAIPLWEFKTIKNHILIGGKHMDINLSAEVIETVYNSLRNSKQGLKLQLEVSLPNGKVNLNRKEIIEHQLEEVEYALDVFEELMEN